MQTKEIKGAPVLQGFDFSPKEIRAAESGGKILDANLLTATTCNARCPTCYAEAGGLIRQEREELGMPFLTFGQWQVVVEKLAPHIKTLVLSGEGDITFDHWPENQRLIDEALSLDLQVVMFTNGITMDEQMTDWMASRKKLSVIGKWYHPNPLENDALMGIKPHKLDQRYVEVNRLKVPIHIKLLCDRGLAGNHRLAIGNTVIRKNMNHALSMWRFLREHSIIPIFSWLTPTGFGRNYQLEGHDLTGAKKKELTIECWQVDNELGINWQFGLGPHIGSTECKDTVMLVIDALGRVRRCPSSHQDALGNIGEQSVTELLQIKQKMMDGDWLANREAARGQTTCACTLTEGGRPACSRSCFSNTP